MAALFGIAEEADAVGAQAIVDVRVVDDLAGEEDVAAGEARDRLVGVVDGPIDAVAEPELAGEVEREPPLVVAVIGAADLVDEAAVVRRRSSSARAST
jgi:hypothetical protein